MSADGSSVPSYSLTPVSVNTAVRVSQRAVSCNPGCDIYFQKQNFEITAAFSPSHWIIHSEQRRNNKNR